MYVCGYAHVCMRALTGQKGALDPLGAGITGGYELLDAGARS